MSSKIFVGSPTCRNADWLGLALTFPGDVNTVASTLRSLPPWTHPIAARLIPARYRMKRKIDLAAKIIRPLMEEIYQRQQNQFSDSDHCDDTLLDWMMEHGDNKETCLLEMATRQCLLMLASVHTTSMTVSHALFDLCAYPEWFKVLGDEIDAVPEDIHNLQTGKQLMQAISRLEIMDSFLVESLRFHPPTLRKTLE